MSALEVKTEVVIDHWELGKDMAGWNSEEQAHFLHGLATGVKDLGGSGHLQMHYIVEALQGPGPHLDDVRRLVELMADYFAEVPA
jgi:hypothetical protein